MAESTHDTIDDDIRVANLVGSGDFGTEIDLGALASDIDLPEARHEEGMGSLFLRFEEGGGLVILYRSGKYIVRGGKSYETLYGTNQQVINLLTDFGIVDESVDPDFEVRNIVCVVDSGREINLQALIVLIGLENAELEPEQFPGLVYRPEEFNCIFLIFSSGKIVVTGSSDEAEIVDAVESVLETIHSLD